MLFPLYRKGPLFTNTVLNDYIKNSEYSYMKNINKTVENISINKNRKNNILAGETHDNEENSLIVIPSIFFLSLTTIIYYFYSKIC
jgi:hypothetical protein